MVPRVKIRRVDANDFGDVTRLLEELGRPNVDVGAREGARAIFEQQLRDAEHLVALDDDGTAVGFCSLHIRPRLNFPTPEAWIPDLIVTESSRATGVGRALLEAAEARA